MNFITISNKKEKGKIFDCQGNIFASKIENKQIILCAAGSNTYSFEIAYRDPEDVLFTPTVSSKQENLYPGTGINTQRPKTNMYATEPMPISAMLSAGNVVATSKFSPLVLYYRYDDKQKIFGLFLHNLETRNTQQIFEKKSR